MILFLINATQPELRTKVTQHNPYAYHALPPPPLYKNTTPLTRWNWQTSVNLKTEIKRYQRFSFQLMNEPQNIEVHKSCALSKWLTIEREYKDLKLYLNNYNRNLVKKLKLIFSNLFTKLTQFEEFIKQPSLPTPQRTTEDTSDEEISSEDQSYFATTKTSSPSESLFSRKKSFLEIVHDLQKKQTQPPQPITQLSETNTSDNISNHPKLGNTPSLKPKKKKFKNRKIENGWIQVLGKFKLQKLKYHPPLVLKTQKEKEEKNTSVSETTPMEKKYPKFNKKLKALANKEKKIREKILLNESFEYNVALEQLELLQDEFLERNAILLETFKMHIIIFLELKLYHQAKILCDEYHTLDSNSVIPLMFKLRIALECPMIMEHQQLATDFKHWFNQNPHNPIRIFYYANFLQATRNEDSSSSEEITTLFQKSLLLFQTSNARNKEFEKLITVHLLLLEETLESFCEKLQSLNPALLIEIFGNIPKINTNSIQILIKILKQYAQKLRTELSQKEGFYYRPTKDEKEIFDSFLQQRQERRKKLHLTFSRVVLSFLSQRNIERAFQYATEEFDKKDSIHDLTHCELKRDLIKIIVLNCNIDDLETTFKLRALLMNNGFLEYANALSEACMDKHKNNPQLYFQYIKIFENHLRSGKVDTAKTQFKFFLDEILPQLTDTSSHKEIYIRLAQLSQQIDHTIDPRITAQLEIHASDFLRSLSALP